jgi:hypothetical protein
VCGIVVACSIGVARGMGEEDIPIAEGRLLCACAVDESLRSLGEGELIVDVATTDDDDDEAEEYAFRRLLAVLIELPITPSAPYLRREVNIKRLDTKLVSRGRWYVDR